jgi:type IV pilus assembly protein PilF
VGKAQRAHQLLLISSLIVFTGCSSVHTSSDEKQDQKPALVNTQLGMAYLQNQQIPEAKQKLLLALKQDPSLPEAWYSMGYFYESIGDAKEANSYYVKAVSLAPTRGDVQNNYGTYLCRTGDYSAAIQHFLSATQDKQYLDTASAYENAGLCALKIPDKKLAMQYFTTALTQDSNHPTSLIELAQLQYERGNYAVAKQNLQQFLSISAATPQSKLLSEQLAKVKS